MIRVNVTYAAKPGARFDHDYYVHRHLKMVRELCAPFGLTEITADKGLAGALPGAPAAYTCVANLTFHSVEAVQQALAAHAGEILGDLPNYTDLEPVIQVSEILL